MMSDYDIVHYHCLGPALFSFLPRLVGKKTVVTVQGLDWQRGKWGQLASRVLQAGETAAIRGPNATLVVSRTLQKHFLEKYQAQTIYVPNGAKLAVRKTPKRLQEWGLAADGYVLFLGRFSPEKNCHLLVNAFQDLDTEMKLVFAGGSSHSNAYTEALQSHASDQIRFLPWVSGDDLDELLSNAALFVLPSALEGMSLALLDAMAAGVCVLASDIPENDEVVQGSGFTFKSGDQTDLERMLALLLRNPELRRQAAVRERVRIQAAFRWPYVAQRLEFAYYDVLGWEPNMDAPRDSVGVDVSATR
jgi:glycosyltransferase involved in cell wall biosynthesis